MTRRFLLIAALLLIALCLSIHVQAPILKSAEPVAEATTEAPTEEPTTEAPTEEPATEPPTEAPTTEPPTEPPTEAELFYTLLTQNYWYHRALSCTFADPTQLSAEFYFYNGLFPEDRESPSDYTEEEIAFLESVKPEGNFPEWWWQETHKLPAVKMNEALSILNVTLDDLQIPEAWIYDPATDAYYDCRFDAFGVVGVTVTDVVHLEKGVVQVYWSVSGPHLNTLTGEIVHDPNMVITLQEQPDGSYLVLSNLPVQ